MYQQADEKVLSLGRGTHASRRRHDLKVRSNKDLNGTFRQFYSPRLSVQARDKEFSKLKQQPNHRTLTAQFDALDVGAELLHFQNQISIVDAHFTL